MGKPQRVIQKIDKFDRTRRAATSVFSLKWNVASEAFLLIRTTFGKGTWHVKQHPREQEQLSTPNHCRKPRFTKLQNVSSNLIQDDGELFKEGVSETRDAQSSAPETKKKKKIRMLVLY